MRSRTFCFVILVSSALLAINVSAHAVETSTTQIGRTQSGGAVGTLGI